MNGTYRSGTDPYLWFVYGVGTIGYSWGEFFSGGPFLSSQWLTIGHRGQATPGELPYLNLSSQTGYVDPRDADRVTFEEEGTHQVILKDVEYVDATVGTEVDLIQVGHFGFTSDASLDRIYADVGNHAMQFTTAIKDNSLHLGDGWDSVTLGDQLDIPGAQYWGLIRRADGVLDAYSLLTGYRIRMEDGAEARNGVQGYRNFGEVEQIFLKDARTGETEEVNPGGHDLPDEGDRGFFENIDLRSDGETFSDSFNLAYFNAIRYTSDNVWAGEATIHDGDDYSAPGNHLIATAPVLAGQLSVLGQSRNGTHDLVVAEQAQAIDGKLRLYAFDTDSGLYNEFNQIYLGTSAADNADKSGITGSDWADRVALYGFGGQDVLKGGAGRDYLFGGQSSYNQLVDGAVGNQVTGGEGADYFGVGNTDTAGVVTGASTTIGSAATGTFHQGYATDVIMDWHAGQDTVVVLANGVAVVAGLRDGSGLVSLAGANVIDFRAYAAIATSDQDFDGARGGDNWDATQTLAYIYANQITRDGNSITNEGDITVVNAGLIVARGLEGSDTLHGSAGNDYLYGNGDANLISLSGGGSDRVYYDTFDAAQAKQYVAGFDTANDQFYLNKRVIDAFGGDTARGLSAADVSGTYTQSVAYSAGVNFLHDTFYSPSILDSNTSHDSADGAAPGLLTGSDGTTFSIGVGMIAVGYALMTIPFVGPALGAPLIVSGGLLGAGGLFVNTQEHRNATFDGWVGSYLNVITSDTLQAAGNTAVATSASTSNDNVRFLDFFGASDAGDGYIPVVEFTAHDGVGIYGYFALHSTTETFVFLVASRDNLVENGEAIKVAEINGLLTADDFKIYDGEADIYNVGTEAPIVLLDPTVQGVEDATSDEGMGDNLIDDVQGPVQITVGISGAVAGGSYLKVYDKTTLIYDGSQGTPVNGNVSASLSGNTYTITDSRSLGTVATQTDASPVGADNQFVLRDSVVNYSVEFVDGTTGIPTRDGSGAITISGGNGTIDGGSGTDTLSITGTSDYLNGASDAQILGIETIFASAKDSDEDGDVDAGDDAVILDLSAQTEGFGIYGSSLGDSLVGGQGDDTIFGLTGQDTIDLSAGGADLITFSYSAAGLAANVLHDVITGMSSDDRIEVVASGMVDTDNDGTTDTLAAGFDDRDGDATRLMYETSTLAANRAVASGTELLVVSNSVVSSAGDLTADIAVALNSAFRLSGLDGTTPSASTGGGTDSSLLFAVKSDTGSYWVGRYEDRGNDETPTAGDIEVFAEVSSTNILDSFWLSTVRAPQALTMTMPANTGPIEVDGHVYTQNLGVTVSGLAAHQQLVYSLDNGATWTFNAVGDNTFDLADNTYYSGGRVEVRAYDATGYSAPAVGTVIAAASLPEGNYSSAITDNSMPITTDNTAAPLAAPDLAAADDNGTSDSDNVTTKMSGLTFTGTAEADTLVKFFKGATELAQVTADGSGNYSFDVALGFGTHSMTVQIMDKAGNVSTSSGLQVVVTGTDISSGNSLGAVSGPVLLNNTNFASYETIDSAVYVDPALTTTDTSTSVGFWNSSSPTSGVEVLTSQYGLVSVGDAWINGNEIVIFDPFAAANVISGMTVDSAWQNAKSFFYMEGWAYAGVDTVNNWEDTNRGGIWYWEDTGDGYAQSHELYFVAERHDLPDATTGGLQYVI